MGNKKNSEEGISAISVRGFKSLANACCFEIRPLTILAGANSSGKSSAVQPLLLMKQTLDATYDPGPLRLDGPNVRFTSTDQVLSRVSSKKRRRSFVVGIDLADHTLELTFDNKATQGFRLAKVIYDKIVIRPEMSQSALRNAVWKLASIPHEFFLNRTSTFSESVVFSK